LPQLPQSWLRNLQPDKADAAAQAAAVGEPVVPAALVDAVALLQLPQGR